MTRIRHESSVTAISWIPSEAIEGLSRIPFELGVTHYDQPPPDQIDDIDALRKADRFREANELRAFVGRVGPRTRARIHDPARRREAQHRTLDVGATLTTQGESATDVYLVMDGIFAVEIDGQDVAGIGPGAVVGERAAVEGGIRTATLRATTRARVAAIAPHQLNPADLEELASSRRPAAPACGATRPISATERTPRCVREPAEPPTPRWVRIRPARECPQGDSNP